MRCLPELTGEQISRTRGRRGPRVYRGRPIGKARTEAGRGWKRCGRRDCASRRVRRPPARSGHGGLRQSSRQACSASSDACWRPGCDWAGVKTIDGLQLGDNGGAGSGAAMAVGMLIYLLRPDLKHAIRLPHRRAHANVLTPPLPFRRRLCSFVPGLAHNACVSAGFRR